jgi:hypothetical protein
MFDPYVYRQLGAVEVSLDGSSTTIFERNGLHNSEVVNAQWGSKFSPVANQELTPAMCCVSRSNNAPNLISLRNGRLRAQEVNVKRWENITCCS